MKRNLMIRVIAVFLAISLTGCGGQTGSDTSAVGTSEVLQTENSSEDNTDFANDTQDYDSPAEELGSTKEESDVTAMDNSTTDGIEDISNQDAAYGSSESEQEIEEDIIPDEQKSAPSEDELSAKEAKEKEQMNSFSMMYYLAITAENIRTSKNNRLILDEIYTSLLNDINPGSIDEITQEHLQNLRDIIKSYLNISVKRERLQYIYNQKKAAAMRSAVPNPIAILSMTNSLDWKKLALATVYAVVDSYTSYKNASESADQEFIMSGWELDDEEIATVQKNRDRAFDYMVDMVQEYGLDGMMTLNEKSIEKFSKICAIESIPEKKSRLESEEETYRLLGNYWLELADCYFQQNQYEKCLECVDKYNEVSTGIYRKDFNYVQILPKAIVAAQNVYSGEEYVTNISNFAAAIIRNTSTEDWSTRYFVAQVYLDLYSKTNNEEYLNSAYKIARSNVTVLLGGQRTLNNTYLNKVEEVTVEEPDYRYMTDTEKKEAKKEYKEEQKRAKKYNASLKEARKTELPTLYEPLVLNCELLFALADKLQISEAEQTEIEAILETESNGIFLSKPINDKYSFSGEGKKYNINLTKNEISIPANLLTSEAAVTITVKDAGKIHTFDDCSLRKVAREGKEVETFVAYYTSNQMKKYKWTPNSEVTVEIKHSDAYDEIQKYHFVVSEFKKRALGDTVVFEEK